MNLPKMIAELRAERDRLDQAIIALERLSIANAKRRSQSVRFKLTAEREGTSALPEAPPPDAEVQS